MTPIRTTTLALAAGLAALPALAAAQAREVTTAGFDAQRSNWIRTDVRINQGSVQDGSFKGGTDTVFDIKSGGVGLGKVSADGQKYEEQVNQVMEQIKSGEITDIPSEVK